MATETVTQQEVESAMAGKPVWIPVEGVGWLKLSKYGGKLVLDALSAKSYDVSNALDRAEGGQT